MKKNGCLYRSENTYEDDAQVYALIDKIVAPLGRRVDESSPMVNARLAEGHRVNAVIPPLALDGPVVTIHKFRAHAFSLEEMRELGSFDEQVDALLRWSVLRRCNIAVSGGTGSGKTTLLNALSASIPFDERIVTIEDSAELRFNEHPHVVRLESRQRNAEGTGEVPIRELVINSLRMRPDRIVVGECRGAEALDMLQAMSTGHDGSLTTLHANSPEEAVSRLTTMVRYGAELPLEAIEAQIANAIDLVVQTTRYPDGRRGICELAGYSWDKDSSSCIVQTYFKKDMVTGRKAWIAFPSWLDDLPYLGIASKEEVAAWQRRASC
ncbi:MAG: ATPase, T2SS/T4P/T4SS family [Eggerthellaceae bacterium]|nr:ATPase, T2SS/T4P/T4SS family [Eggerthellaceae bacterium]